MHEAPTPAELSPIVPPGAVALDYPDAAAIPAALHGPESSLAGLTVVVTGLGVSGYPASVHLAERGAEVIVVDADTVRDRSEQEAILAVFDVDIRRGPEHVEDPAEPVGLRVGAADPDVTGDGQARGPHRRDVDGHLAGGADGERAQQDRGPVRGGQGAVRGDGDGAEAHRKFYDEYLAVMDLSAEFYLQTIERVFQKRLMAQGEYRYRGRLVEPSAMTDIGLMTIEGEKDDITGLGQTEAAHDLADSLPADRRKHHVAVGVGHYGVFNGSRWRNTIQPGVRDFIRVQRQPVAADVAA